MDAEARRAARERLAEELAGGRWLLAPGARRAKTPAGQEEPPEPKAPSNSEASAPPEKSAETSERVRRFREKKTERAERDRTAAEAAARAEAAPPPAGISAKEAPAMFATESLTDASEGAAERLAAMEKIVSGCQLCELHATRTKTVFGDGSPTVELVFVGEAPGADEDASGVPFVGRAGKLLDKIIAAMGLARGEVYICNVLKCRPPGNRNPQPDEVAHCWPYLKEQLEILAPKVICTLGAPATKTLMGTDESIGRMRGAVHDYHGTPLVATYHPAYLLRDPRQKAKVWEDMKMVLKVLGRSAPRKKAAP